MAKLELFVKSAINNLNLSQYKDGIVGYIAQHFPIELCDILERGRMPVVPDIVIDREKLAKYGDDQYGKLLVETELKALVAKRIDRVSQLESHARSLYVIMYEQLGIELQNLVRAAAEFANRDAARDVV
jgi:hypothetical protein